MKHGTTEDWIVLLAHGSADERWRRPFEDLRAKLAERVTTHGVSLAYLQFCEPTIEQALGACRTHGGQRALVIPVFMSGGGHLLRDLPRAVTDAAARTGIEVEMTGAVAEEPEVQDAMVGAFLRLARDPSAGRNTR